MSPIGVMQVTDTLMAGGLERMAVNIANNLPTERFSSHLCATRQGGPLSELLSKEVHYLELNRRTRFDSEAFKQFLAQIRARDIRILHAHGSSLFLAVLASAFRPYPMVIWHDHFGRNDTEERPVLLYRMFARRVSAVIAVNPSLAKWSRERLRIPPEWVWYMPNFISAVNEEALAGKLPGQAGSRIVCVANLRQQKDHLTLLRAMSLVAEKEPGAHLLLVGSAGDSTWLAQVKQEMSRPILAGRVSWLGARRDVFAILRQCSIGVLSSRSEGLPLALIEYGWARLPTVATHVGQCAEVLGNGDSGLLVPPATPEALAQALQCLLKSPGLRAEMGEKIFQHVRRTYDPTVIMSRICSIYESVLASREKRSPAQPLVAAD